jgi:hypothetical protein
VLLADNITIICINTQMQIQLVGCEQKQNHQIEAIAVIFKN